MRYREKKSGQLIVMLAVGFLVGIIYENIVSGKDETLIRMFQSEQLQLFGELQIDSYTYLLYILKKRIVPLLVIVLLWSFKWRKPFVLIAVSWCGLLFGRMIVAAMISQGIRGVLICLAILFPQTIFYALVYIILVVHLYSDKRRWWNKGKTAAVAAFFLLGVLTEVYINPMILEMIINFV